MMKRLTTMLCGLGFGLFISSLLLLAGCSKEEAEGERLPDGQYPMNFTASVEGQTATRATTDNSWTGGEEVAIQVGDEVKKYTAAAATGVLSAASDVTPFYWQTTADIEVTAWHSHNYSSARPASFTVQTDQSSTGYQQSDLLYASAQQVTFETPAALTFKHLPAKVVVNLKAGDGVMDNDVQSATVSIVNQALTSGAIDTHWVVAQATAGNSVITPNVLPTTTTDYQKSLQAIVVPQQMQSKKFIRVTAGGNDYFYTPATDANLEAGKQYTYNITVQKNGLTVTASGATEWTGSTITVESKEIKQGFAATDLKVCDYYYSDGTWSDGGYREYTDKSKATLPIMPVLINPTTGKERKVIGLVYWVVDATKKDKTLAKDHPECTHGLVVALTGNERVMWQDPSISIQEWLDNNKNVVGEFMPVETGTGSNALVSNIQGYNNTKAIEAFNADVANSDSLAVIAVQTVVEYRTKVPAPQSSSDWYLPSTKELSLLSGGKDILNIGINNSGGTANHELISSKLKFIGGTPQFQLFRADYWSSTEHSHKIIPNVLINVYFNDGYVHTTKKNDRFSYVRSVLAF